MGNLKKILIEVIDYLNQSQNSDWSPLTPKELVKNLEVQIGKLERNEKVDKNLLRIEFAPTSTIQEISMANGWSDEYLNLSLQFDKEIIKLK